MWNAHLPVRFSQKRHPVASFCVQHGRDICADAVGPPDPFPPAFVEMSEQMVLRAAPPYILIQAVIAMVQRKRFFFFVGIRAGMRAQDIAGRKLSGYRGSLFLCPHRPFRVVRIPV